MSEREFNQIFSERLRYYLTKYEMTQLELSKLLGVGTTSVYNWCNGIKTPRMDKVDAMCDIFHCKRSDLMEDKTTQSHSTAHTGVTINVLGRVAAGIPIDAIEEVIDTEEITEEMAKTGEFFGLKIKGNSMEPRIYETMLSLFASKMMQNPVMLLLPQSMVMKPPVKDFVNTEMELN